MKIKFLKPCKMEVTNWYDERQDVVHTTDEIFKEGETVEADIVETDDEQNTAQIQFGNGDVVYGVPKTLFEIVES